MLGGELGAQEVPLESVNYGLREHDRVAFIAQHYPRGERRVENGTRAEVLQARERQVTVRLDGSDRQVTLTGEELETLRLAYAAHIYRQQGATAKRSIVLTGGWQTSRESSYVNASRAREGTDWYLAREELGIEGTDLDRIKQLSQIMRLSRAQIPSVAYEQVSERTADPRNDDPWDPRGNLERRATKSPVEWEEICFGR